MNDNTPEIRIVARAKNNRLVKLREELGMSQMQVAKAMQTQPGSLGCLENMKDSPLRKDGVEWRPLAKKIASFYGVSRDYIWPESVRSITAKEMIMEVNASNVLQWDSWIDDQPALLSEDHEREHVVVGALGRLKDRERRIIERRFGIGTSEPATYKDIATEEGVSTERIRQIEAKALGRLRHPGVAKRLRPYLDDPISCVSDGDLDTEPRGG